MCVCSISPVPKTELSDGLWEESVSQPGRKGLNTSVSLARWKEGEEIV